ncbi:immunoglobulin domain-containing protein, partial [Salinivibrio sp. VYel6]|uniref:immunoglobulin domain-containing protein n=1 Tax=Salinivibrio sp. VYel6 TaxID=2490493 RepID=UPI00156236E6
MQPLRITKNPSDVSLKDKETLSLSCAVDAGRSTFVKYQWYRNGSAISGATSSTLSRKVSMGDNGASWQCHITNDVGTVKTRAVESVVKPLN